jgi:hypothetical protein
MLDRYHVSGFNTPDLLQGRRKRPGDAARTVTGGFSRAENCGGGFVSGGDYPRAARSVCQLRQSRGVERYLLYNADYKLVQYCDGVNWIGMS